MSSSRLVRRLVKLPVLDVDNERAAVTVSASAGVDKEQAAKSSVAFPTATYQPCKQSGCDKIPLLSACTETPQNFFCFRAVICPSLPIFFL